MIDGWQESRGLSGRWRLALVCLCALGLLVSLVRGPVGAVRGGSSDFALFYTSARVWANGGNPYDVAAVAAEWDRVIPAGIWHVRERGPVLLYPPSAFVVIAPIAVLPFAWAAVVWAALNTVLAGVAIWAAARLAGLRGLAGLAFLTGCVWLAPIASSIKFGQTGVLIVACVAAGALLRARGRAGGGGVAAGIGAAIKPQLGLLFVVYELGRGRWRFAAGAAAAGALLLGIGAARMWAAGVAWVPAWRAQLHEFQLLGDGNPTVSNHVRSQMINLHYPLHSLIESRAVVTTLVFGLVGLLCAAYFVVDLRRGRERGEGRGEVISLGMVAVVTLLVAYHRAYDAAALIFPLAAAVRALGEARNARAARLAAWAILGFMVVFVVPASAALLTLELHGWTIAGRHLELPAGVAKGFWWNFVIMPNQVWALVGIAACLVVLRGTVAPTIDGSLTRRST